MFEVFIIVIKLEFIFLKHIEFQYFLIYQNALNLNFKIKFQILYLKNV